jgi:hypothetical protein
VFVTCIYDIIDRAGKAQQTGAFDKEIVPITTKVTGKDGNEQTITVRLITKFENKVYILWVKYAFFYAPEIEDQGAYCFCPVCHSV